MDYILTVLGFLALLVFICLISIVVITLAIECYFDFKKQKYEYEKLKRDV